jgi:selenocysteine-specific elongation factor
VLACAGAGPIPTYRVDARLDCTPAARVMVHHGTRETPARAVHYGGDEWQLRLDSQLVAAAGDRLVIRTIAPPDTLGGGTVLDPAPPRTRTPGPTGSGERKGETRVRPASPETVGPEVEERLRAAGLEPPLDVEFGAGELAALREHGRAVRVGPAMHFHVDALAEAERRLRALLEQEERVTLARFRDELQTSRKYAQALLEHFDSERLTLRIGDERVLRRGPSRPLPPEIGDR